MIRRALLRAAALTAALFFTPLEAFAQVLNLRSTVFNDQRLNLIEQISFRGDLRFRHETFNKRTAPNRARQRQRYRFRYEAKINLPNFVTVGTRFAGAAGSQVSTNQSFDDLDAATGIILDQIYLRWAPWLSDDGSVKLSVGRMPNPFWAPYSADIVWDSDVNPQGLSQGVEWFIAPLGGVYFANAQQMVVDEDAASTADQWLISGQVGAEYRLPFENRLRFAVGYHHWINERASSFSAAEILEGNRRDGGGVLLNEFDVLQLDGQWTAWARRMPLAFQGTFIKNTRARNWTGLPAGALFRNTRKEDTGYQVGARLGDARLKGEWEMAYFYKWVETDATVADLADSDFGDGGTNRRGHIFWGSYAPVDWMLIQAKYFYTKVINPSLPPTTDDINRFQLDFNVRF